VFVDLPDIERSTSAHKTDTAHEQEPIPDLDGTRSSWNRALELLIDVLSLAPALLILVIDGLLAFEEGQEQEIKDLINLLRK
jgi:hypothetical protein